MIKQQLLTKNNLPEHITLHSMRAICLTADKPYQAAFVFTLQTNNFAQTKIKIIEIRTAAKKINFLSLKMYLAFLFHHP